MTNTLAYRGSGLYGTGYGRAEVEDREIRTVCLIKVHASANCNCLLIKTKIGVDVLFPGSESVCWKIFVAIKSSDQKGGS